MRKKSNSKKRKSSFERKIVLFSIVTLLVTFSCLFIYQNRDYILYYLSFKSKNGSEISPANKKANQEHIDVILEEYKNKIFGIDVSEYQGTINWNLVTNIHNKKTIQFVVVRATAGKNKVDSNYKENWNNIKSKYIRGAYHYYRPNENSIEQANNFIKNVTLSKGDFPPILDIEKLPKTQSIDSLKVGLRRWLEKVESHYKVKPIIYSGESYYTDFLEEEFSDYPFWIANYNFWKKNMDSEWFLWQFTENATINGIIGPVDVNVFNGTKSELKQKCIRF